MNITDPKLLTDLEIDDKILPNIDKTITSFGKSKLKEMFRTVKFNQSNLIERKAILQSLLNKSKKTKLIVRKLKKIRKLEDDINWFFDSNEDNIKELYFSYEFLNVKDMLSIKNFLKTFVPSIVIVVYLLIYSVLRYYGIKIDIINYFKSIYKSYQIFISMLLSSFISNENLISFLTNSLSTLYILYQFYTFYSSLETTIDHYKKCRGFRDSVSKMRELIDLTKFINKRDTFLSQEKSLIKRTINRIDKKFSNNDIKSLGYILLLKRNSKSLEKDFDILTGYIGTIDALISISKLVLINGYTFPSFDFLSTKPYIEAQDVWNPHFPLWEQVLNSCSLGGRKSNNCIITGPNTSGKSTFIRNVMVAVFLSQTIGVSPCRFIVFTPFACLFTYIDIPNIVRNKESLFEAEILKCSEFCQVLESLPSNLFAFTIMDELFTGTNPKEGVAGSYGVCEYLGGFSNSLMIVTTHFTELTHLGQNYPDSFSNKKFIVSKLSNGSFYKPFKIQDGVSDQNIAIDLLQQKGYSNQIISRARDKLSKL